MLRTIFTPRERRLCYLLSQTWSISNALVCSPDKLQRRGKHNNLELEIITTRSFNSEATSSHSLNFRDNRSHATPPMLRLRAPPVVQFAIFQNWLFVTGDSPKLSKQIASHVRPYSQFTRSHRHGDNSIRNDDKNKTFVFIQQIRQRSSEKRGTGAGILATSFPDATLPNEVVAKDTEKEFFRREALDKLLTQKSGLFDDHRQSYGTKSTWTILKSLLLFFFCRFNVVTENSERILNLISQVLGKRIGHALIKEFVFNQFVVEPTPSAIMAAVESLGARGVGVLLAVPIEDDDGSRQVDARLDSNLDLVLRCAQLVSQNGVDDPLLQLRVTALMSGTLTKIVSEMCSKAVNPEIDYIGNPDLPISVESTDAMVKAMQGDGFDFLQIPGWESFPLDKVAEFQRALTRCGTLAKSLLEHDITAMMDAEKTYLNPALRHVVFALMEICSKDKPRVFYTYQAYLKTTYGMMSKDLDLADSRGTCFGVKLVRGAYMIQERQLARKRGYPDPVNDSFDLTSDSYHRCLNRLLERARLDEKSVRFILASHNESTLYYAFRRMDELGLSPLSPSVIYGQLYGMADHISYVLGASGCRVVKSVPYGSMADTIPYLARRAQENKSVLQNARKERALLRRALRDKVTPAMAQ